jgi:hypothetical protein
VDLVARRAGGKALVVEYPPPPGRRWSHYWLRGRDWPRLLPTLSSVGVPGLVPAREAGNLLLRPDRFVWREDDTGNWGGANRWLVFLGYVTPLTISIAAFVAAIFAGFACYLVSTEERAPFAAFVLRCLILAPAAFLLSGNVTRVAGQGGYLLWLLCSFLGLVLVAGAAGPLVRKIVPHSQPLLPVFLVGLAATLFSPPLWTIYSNVLGLNPQPVSPEAAGAVFGYLVGVLAFGRGSWLMRGVGLAVFGFGFLQPAWWVNGIWPFAILPLVALIVGEGYFRRWMLAALAVIPLADLRLAQHGFVWAPGDLFPNAASREAVNLARYLEFLLSPIVFGSLALALVVGMFSERYLFHELRRTLLRDSRMRALFQAAAACGAMALLQPLLLYPAFMCLVGGFFALLSDTARSV